MSFTEITGYAGSLIVLVSFLMGNMRYLRIVNSIGCAIFIGYGILLHYSWPIIITNTAIVGINLFYLFKKEKPTN